MTKGVGSVGSPHACHTPPPMQKNRDSESRPAPRRREVSASQLEAQRSQRLFEVLMATTAELHCIIDGEHRIRFANAAFRQHWPAVAADEPGRSLVEVGFAGWQAQMHGCEVDQVLRTGEPVRGEVACATGADGEVRVFEYVMLPLGPAAGVAAEVGMTLREVTGARRAAGDAQFLAAMVRQLEGLDSEAQIMRQATAALGGQLGLHRCYFVECLAGGTQIVVGENWVRDKAPSLAGTLSMFDARGQEWCSWYFAGPGAFADVRRDPLTSHRAEYYESIQVRAYVVQPLKRDGHYSVVLAATDDRPRQWSAAEVQLIERLGAAVWPLIERARAQQRVREAESRLKVISDHLPGLVTYIGRDLCIHFNNRAAAEALGYHGGLCGVHLRTILGEEIYQQRLPFLERALAGETVRFQGPIHHHIEGLQVLDLTYIPDSDQAGRVRGVYVLGFDLTEHKRTREALASHSDRLRLLWACARVLLTTDDPDTMLHRLFSEIGGNLGADAFFNFVVDPSGKRLRLRSWRGISDAEASMLSQIGFHGGACGEVARTRRPVVRSIAAEGLGLCAYAGYPLVSGGQLLGTLGFASRTKESFSGDELEFIEILSHYVTAAYVRLELMASLRHADRRKDEFLATLAHELRNPLAPICAGLEVLRRVQERPAQAAEVIGVLERQASQMVRLINDLVDVSRITRGTLQLERRLVGLDTVLASAVETARPLIDAAGHELVVADARAAAVVLDADAGRLSQVFSNLLNNAARYTPDGGRIEVFVEVAGRSVTVAVRDNGEGIDPCMQEQIFEMFTQLNRSEKSVSQGLGIGLWLVRLLVRMHGGSIEVRSDGLGEGSEFRVTLPCVEAVVVEEESGEGVEMPQCLRVLVVDDGVAAADMLAMFLELEGFEVRTAYDGMQALEVAQELRPHVIFLDLGMPRLDGFEAARRIRQLPGCGRVILIALTGWGQDSDRRKTREAGFDYHLVKPIEPRLLREMLANLPPEQTGHFPGRRPAG